MPSPLFANVGIAEERSTMPIIVQIQKAWENKKAFWTGLPFGAVIPGTIFYGVHWEVRPLLIAALEHGVLWYEWTRLIFLCVAVVGGLVVSAKSVYRWGQAGFIDGGKPDNWKAGGTVALLEIWMTFASNIWFAGTLLMFLVAINGLMAACGFALNAKPRRANNG